jgi:GntR family transcriptional regulator, arabinose operon transcriptional repressor
MKNKKIPKYQEIYNKLKNDIINEKYKYGSVFPSERALKEIFNVNHLTIRKSLSILEEEKYLIRKSGVGTTVIYSKNSYTFSENNNISNIYIIIEEIDDFTSEILNKLEVDCRKRDITLSIYCHHRDKNIEHQVYDKAVDHQNSIIILTPTTSFLEWINFSNGLNRTIIFDGYIEGINCPQILSDDISGSYNVVKYLANMGHKKVAHISSDFKITGENRKKGYMKAVEDFNLINDPTLIENGAYLIEGSYFATEKIIKKHPDCKAFFCANDYSAFGAIELLKKKNLFPGKDYSIIGYGDYKVSEVLDLTSVNQQVDKICKQINLLLDEYHSNSFLSKSIYHIPTELRIRNSCLVNEYRDFYNL